MNACPMDAGCRNLPGSHECVYDDTPLIIPPIAARCK